MSESSGLISAFIQGVCAGIVAVIAIAVWRSPLRRDVRVATLLAIASIAAWLVNETQPLWRAVGEPWIVFLLACPVAGLFWLFILTVFADWKITPATLVPPAALLVTGPFLTLDGPPSGWLWVVRNLLAAGLAIHAMVVIVGGWRDDLIERRRRLRVLVVTAACSLVVIEVAAGFAHRLDRTGPWLAVAVGQPIGGALISLVALLLAVLAVQVQPAAFGSARRSETTDTRAEAADRHLLGRLEAVMAGETWRREGLTIGSLAAELDVPEHRLRRLINQRLGHRNFADYVNGYRIKAAQARLADPAQARTTIAAVAFDLGFGSLGPFNRAFRAETGLTPTEWRRQALGESSPKPNEAA